jgi:hypothetical protein
MPCGVRSLASEARELTACLCLSAAALGGASLMGMLSGWNVAETEIAPPRKTTLMGRGPKGARIE